MLKSSALLGVCLLAITASPIVSAKKPINMDVPAQLTIEIDQSVRSTPATTPAPLSHADQVVTPAQAPDALEAPAQPTDAQAGTAPLVDPYAPTPAASAQP